MALLNEVRNIVSKSLVYLLFFYTRWSQSIITG